MLSLSTSTAAAEAVAMPTVRRHKLTRDRLHYRRYSDSQCSLTRTAPTPGRHIDLVLSYDLDLQSRARHAVVMSLIIVCFCGERDVR